MKNTYTLLLLSISLFAFISCKDDEETGPAKSKPFVDSRDGQEYPTVKIGEQVWMSKNLNYDPGNQGGLYYNNDSVNYHIYGRLYLWETVMNGSNSSTQVPSGVQGLCPEGWHLPSINEWDNLIAYMDSKGLKGLDMMDTILWNNRSVPTNSTGFSVRPAGTMSGNGGAESGNINSYTHLMSSTGVPRSTLEGISVNEAGGFSKETNLGVYNYWSCRCLED